MKRNKVVWGGFEPLVFASFSLSHSLSLCFHAHCKYTCMHYRISASSATIHVHRITRDTRAIPLKLPFSLFTYFWPIQFPHSLSLSSVSHLRLLSTLAFLSSTSFDFHSFLSLFRSIDLRAIFIRFHSGQRPLYIFEKTHHIFELCGNTFVGNFEYRFLEQFSNNSETANDQRLSRKIRMK